MSDISGLVSKARDTALPLAVREKAFGLLVSRFQDMAFALAFARLGNREQAEDAAQSAFIEAWRKIGDLRDDRAFAGWLRQIVTSQCHEIERRGQLSTAPLDQAREIAAGGVGPLESVVQRHLGDSLRSAMETLSENERIIVSLFYIGEYTSREIGELMETPETTVKKRLRTARAKLKEALLLMVQEEAGRTRPSRSDTFANTIALFNAAAHGDAEKVHALLALDPSLVNARSAYMGRTHNPLHVAASAGHTEVVRLLLESGADVRVRDVEDNATALHWAAENDHREIVRLLVEAGSDINARDDKHEAGPLGWATNFKHVNREVAEYLIQAGAKPGIFTAIAMGEQDTVLRLVRDDASQLTRHLSIFDGEVTPLIFALRRGQLQIARTLIDLGATDMTRDEAELTIVFEEGNVSTVRALLRDNPSLAKSIGGKLVIQAARRGSLELCELLLAAGAPANEKDTDGSTALHRASWNGNRAMAQLLVESGADPRIRDDRFHADAYGWADENRQANLMAFWSLAYVLRDCGIDLTQRTTAGETALTLAERMNYREIVCSMADLGGTPTIALAILCGEEAEVRRFLAEDPGLITGQGREFTFPEQRTPLHAAVRAAQPKIVHMLLELGADIEAKVPWGATPLWLACESRCRHVTPAQVKCADVLIKRGANIDYVIPSSLETPLHVAVHAKSIDLVDRLLQAGADHRIRDKGGKTPLEVAIASGQADIAALLRLHGAS